MENNQNRSNEKTSEMYGIKSLWEDFKIKAQEKSNKMYGKSSELQFTGKSIKFMEEIHDHSL